ncbi:MAG: tRNA adenosine(34) deaminase TadA [Porticoccaceae bacterium]|nr:tRNA adenosine(34) deaminase TadA [Porticoccaceae bacterium]
MENNEKFMLQALALAEQAGAIGEVPVGAVVVADGQVIGEGFNQPITACDPTAHAEIIAMRNAAAAVGNYRLTGCDLYVTIEPCTMCVGAMVHARIQRVIFGALEPRAGALASQLKLMDQSHFNHSIDWQGGVLEQQCGALIKDFFKRRR